jgi:hypothetical protein
MNARIETITPELAARWLASAGVNRHLKPRLVRRIAKAITEGEWSLNGESIIFDARERILDGQHRLAAIVAAGVTVQSLVVHGISADAFFTIDSGTARTIQDAAEILGEEEAMEVTRTAKWHWRYKQGMMRAIQGEHLPSPRVILTHLAENPGLRDSIKFIQGFGRQPLMSLGLAAALHRLFVEYAGDTLANEFFEVVLSGKASNFENLTALRGRLMRAANMRHGRIHEFLKAAFAIKAFNAWMRNESYVRFVFDQRGLNTEPFPVIGGRSARKDIPVGSNVAPRARSGH